MRIGVGNKKNSELAVITKAKDLGNYIFTVTDKSPKKFRFTLVGRLQNLSLDIIESLYYANSIFVRGKEDHRNMRIRSEYQKKAYVKLKLLAYMALLAREQNCILPKQHEQISLQSSEVNKLLLAWAKSDRRRYNPT